MENLFNNKSETIVLLGNVFETNFKYPIIIDKNIQIDKASDYYTNIILKTIKRIGDIRFARSSLNDDKNSFKLNYDFNFYILKPFKNENLSKYLILLSLMDERIQPLIIIDTNSDDFQIFENFHQILTDIKLIPIKLDLIFIERYKILVESINRIFNVSIKSYLKKNNEKYYFIFSALSDYSLVIGLNKNSIFKYFAFFSIIEKLIFSKGTNKITHKFKCRIKSILDKNNTNFNFNIKKYLKNIESINEYDILGNLYEYRSCIAHGRKINFNDKKNKQFNNFKSEDDLRLMVLELCKYILIQSIIYPDFFIEIRIKNS